MRIYSIMTGGIYTREQQDRLNKLGDFINLQKTKPTDDEIIELAGDAEILIAAPSGFADGITEKLLSSLKSLKFITTVTTGTHWIDLKGAKKLGIPVSNAKGANAESVAEHTWGMLLDLAKRINEFSLAARDKGEYDFKKYLGIEVLGKTIGVLGTGDIGAKVARIAKAGFNMNVLGFNKSGREVEHIKLTDLDTLLTNSDFIAVCLPFTQETKHLINEKRISTMRDGVIIINCADENIVEKEVIIGAIQSGKVRGYGVETTIMQPAPKEYFEHPNILVTPHNAFYTEEADKATYEVAIDNIETFLNGSPQNLVD